MQHFYQTILMLILASCVAIWAASEEQTKASSSSSRTVSKNKLKQNAQGFRLVAFDTVDKDIALGLNYLMPFLEVPIKRKRNAPPRPLLVVNSAAIFSCGLVAAGGLIVGHLIRSMGLETIVPDSEPLHGSKHTRRLLDEEQSFLQLFDNFKLIYRNTSGDRVETGLPSFMSTMERTFLENDINLPVCLLKSICALTHKAGEKVRSGNATDLELILDGATGWSWLMSFLDQLALRDAVEAGRVAAPEYCTAKYPRCKWTAPDEQLYEMLHNNVQFK